MTHLDVLPLYPQYSCSTTAAVFDGLADIFKRRRTFPSLHFIRSYATHPLYIEALAQSAEAAFAEHGVPDRLILSYHGIPVRYAKEGDVYPQNVRPRRHCCGKGSIFRLNISCTLISPVLAVSRGLRLILMKQ